MSLGLPPYEVKLRSKYGIRPSSQPPTGASLLTTSSSWKKAPDTAPSPSWQKATDAVPWSASRKRPPYVAPWSAPQSNSMPQLPSLHVDEDEDAPEEGRCSSASGLSVSQIQRMLRQQLPANGYGNKDVHCDGVLSDENTLECAGPLEAVEESVPRRVARVPDTSKTLQAIRRDLAEKAEQVRRSKGGKLELQNQAPIPHRRARPKRHHHTRDTIDEKPSHMLTPQEKAVRDLRNFLFDDEQYVKRKTGEFKLNKAMFLVEMQFASQEKQFENTVEYSQYAMDLKSNLRKKKEQREKKKAYEDKKREILEKEQRAKMLLAEEMADKPPGSGEAGTEVEGNPVLQKTASCFELETVAVARLKKLKKDAQVRIEEARECMEASAPQPTPEVRPAAEGKKKKQQSVVLMRQLQKKLLLSAKTLDGSRASYIATPPKVVPPPKPRSFITTLAGLSPLSGS